MHTETLKSLLPIHRGAPLTRSRRRVYAVMIAATWLQEHDVTTVVDDTLNHHPVQLTGLCRVHASSIIRPVRVY